MGNVKKNFRVAHRKTTKPSAYLYCLYYSPCFLYFTMLHCTDIEYSVANDAKCH